MNQVDDQDDGYDCPACNGTGIATDEQLALYVENAPDEPGWNAARADECRRCESCPGCNGTGLVG